MNEEMMRLLGFGKQVDAFRQGKCPFCGKEIDPLEFTTVLSREEYTISGMCQKCQDDFFKEMPCSDFIFGKRM